MSGRGGDDIVREAGEVIKIRNSAGVLEVHVIRKMKMQDVGRGTGLDKLPAMERPRLEVHTCGETTLVTLCENASNGEYPQDIYIVEIYPYSEPMVYVGEFRDSEKREEVFVTVDA